MPPDNVWSKIWSVIPGKNSRRPLESATTRLKKDEERLIVDLFYVEGKKAREIANLLRIKEKAVYKIFGKFKKFFKDKLKIRGISKFE